jgi:hypothetical protein
MKKIILIFGLVLLSTLSALIIYSELLTQTSRRFTGNLEQVLPPDGFDGWKRQEIAIGDSTAAKANVQGILNYSQAVQYLYTKNRSQFLIYIAYWEPSTVSVADVGTHNPDSCWVNNGCTRTERDYAVAGKIGSRSLQPYEYGQYITPQGTQQNVLFWHLVNGQPNRYTDQEQGWRAGLKGRLERVPLLMKDLKEFGLNQKNEQMFIRVSTFMPIKNLLSDPAHEKIFNALEATGIFQDKNWK